MFWPPDLCCKKEKKVKSLSFVQLFATLWTVACQAPLSMGILQARKPDWISRPSSRWSSQPRDWTQVSHIAGGFFTSEPPGKPKNTGLGSLFLLQGIFPTQELNQGLLYCRQTLYHLSHRESSYIYWLLSYFFWTISQSCLRGHVLGLSPLFCLPNKTTFRLWRFFFLQSILAAANWIYSLCLSLVELSGFISILLTICLCCA